MAVQIEIREDSVLACLSGEIDHHSAKEIMQALAAKVELYLPLVCSLDYKDVTFMDSSGIAILIFMLRRMRELQGELRLCNVAAQPLKVMRAAGVNRLLNIKEVCRN